MRWLAVLVVLVGCVKSAAIVCDDGRICPTDNVCDEVNHVCVYPDQLTSCIGLADGTSCAINHVPGGICKGEICIAATCGDELVVGDEICDGNNDIPGSGTCVDFAFDYGALSCSSLCTEGVDGCRRLGWQFRTLTGEGAIHAMWEDGDDLFVASQRGMLHRRSGMWQPIVNNTVWYRSVWAGGGHAFAAATNGSVAHYDGTAWSTTQVAGQILSGIWGRSANDVFAVGGRAGAGEAYRYDGTAWSAMSLPAGTPHLAAVWGTDTVAFAVGDNGTILRSDNGNQTTDRSWTPMVSGSTFRLNGVWGSSATDVFVVGTPTAIEPPGTLAIILHFDGIEWSMRKTPANTFDLMAISGRSANEIYAVGNRTDSNILFYDGGTWAPMVSEVEGAALSLISVHAGASTIYAARHASLFLEYAGVGWLESLSGAGDVRGLWGDGKDYVIGVGDGLAFRRYDAPQGGWGSVTYPACWGLTNFVFDVWGANRDDVWIVGPYGKMLHETTAGLDCVDIPNGKWLVDVWGSGASDVFAVGADGTNAEPNLIHYDGNTWSDWSNRVQSLVPVLSGVWGASANSVFVVGGTKVLRYNGTTWTDAGLVSDKALFAIWGASATDVFVVGAEGAIFHYDGTTWTQMVVPFGITTPTDSRWTDVYGTGPNDVYAVGGRTLLHYDGTSWSPISRTVASSAEAVWAVPGAVVVSGDGGIDPRLIGRLQ